MLPGCALSKMVEGAAAVPVTVMFTTAVVLPPEFVALTVKSVAEAGAPGVPEMTPVVVDRLSPEGRAGDTEYETTAPPRLEGTSLAIAVPTAYTAGFVEYVSDDGGTSLTVMSRAAVVLPPALLAVTVQVARAATAVGVPEMTPVAELRLSPGGSGGETEYALTLPPDELGTLFAIALPFT